MRTLLCGYLLVCVSFVGQSCSEGTVAGEDSGVTDAGEDAGMDAGDDAPDGTADDAGDAAGDGDSHADDGGLPDGTTDGDAQDGDDGGEPVAKEFPEVAIHPGGLAYWDTPYFTNAMYMSGTWLEFFDSEWGTRITYFGNPQFDANGYPQYLDANQKLRGILFGLHLADGRQGPARGHILLTWQGDADIRLNSGGQFLANDSSGAETGSLTDGRRAYLFTDGWLEYLTIHQINPSNPITEIRVWLADPADPQSLSLEDQLFHPTFLARLADRDWGVARFMNWATTNTNPQQDWVDRRQPSHAFMKGVLNPRPPADGYAGDRDSGCAYEYMVMLCNQAGLDLWINVPHLASDDFIRKLARLIRFGSDGTDPYETDVPSPVYPPLRSDLRVYVEYSNEIWSWGDSFAQGEWAFDQAEILGITKPQFNARKFCQVFSIFQEVFGNSQRLVRVAAVHAGNDGYTNPFLTEIRDHGPTLDPPVTADVIAPTTYFGNGIQNFVYEQVWLDGVAPDGPYWTGPEFDDHQEQAFDEWTRRLLSGAAQEGAGPDATGIGGGFPETLHQTALTLFPQPLPLVAYEGGPSIYTNQIEDNDPVKGPLVTKFMGAMNRHPRMAEVYKIHLNMSKSHGLTTHNPFTLVSSWGRYGQWGHLESLDQAPSQSVKYQFLLDFFDEFATIRHIDQPQNQVPDFTTPHQLPPVELGAACQIDIQSTGGDGSIEIVPIGASLVEGLVYDPGQVRIQGTPAVDSLSYLYLRALDADGDPAWRTFSLSTYGGPGTLVECDFTGSNPAQNLPWTQTYLTAPDLNWSGWQAGSGITAESGDNGLFYSVSAPADEADSTLQLALNDQEYWYATLEPQSGTLNLSRAEVRITIRRIDYHAPRIYACMTSVGGFSAGDQVFASQHSTASTDTEHRFELPDLPAYESLAGQVEIRIVGYSGQYSGHVTSIVGFKLRERQ